MPESVQVAFRVYASDWGLRGHGSRQIDWLVDGKLLHTDNVLFVIDRYISRDYHNALRDKGYKIYDAAATHWGQTITQSKRWLRFVDRYSPHHWVSYNDFHPRHKIRNQILRAAGCQTWHYSHSVNLPKEGYAPWKELDYDHLVCWNETDAAQFKGGQKHILGPLFSSQVPRMVVAVFDSTWENYPAGLRDKFFGALYELLEKVPGLVFLYKPKLKPPPMRDVKNFYVLPEWIEPGLVIGCAQFTIGVPHTSPVIEAQGAGCPAAWFDPLTQSVEDLEAMLPRFQRIHNDPAQRFRELLMK
jgi:hypothetical protein